MRGTTLLVLCLSLVGCGGPHLTREQSRFFDERVAPELNRVLQVLQATNAGVAIGKPFQAGDVADTRASTNGTQWEVRRDQFSFTLESHASNVRLLSMMADAPAIQAAMSHLWENPARLVERFQFVHQLGQVEWVNEANPNPTNEYRVAANQIQHLAQALGYRGAGAVVSGREAGVNLEWSRSSNGPPLAVGGGYVGLYCASPKLDSVDLAVLIYRGKVQAILQRPR